MKVERQKAKPTFDPIVITLETEEEAIHLWHKLNSCYDWEEYCKKEGISCNTEWGGLNGRMWRALNEVFKSTRDC